MMNGPGTSCSCALQTRTIVLANIGAIIAVARLAFGAASLN